VSEAEAALAGLEAGRLLDNSHLVSAIYYHDGFLSNFPKDKMDANPSGRITAHIISSLGPGDKEKFVQLLHQVYDRDVMLLPDEPEVTPVPILQDTAVTKQARRRHRRYNHQDAVDLFVPEGMPVRSFSRGVVVIADSEWESGDPLSAVSDQGGNAVVIFDPAANRFYRYCHLASVTVVTGALVQPGQTIGQVGHSGRNASKPGHGHHLHFEANEFVSGVMRSLNESDLKALIRDRIPVHEQIAQRH
jgi:murein DD-endopeptidase MepM/ murein hydrolase activator NlpD